MKDKIKSKKIIALYNLKEAPLLEYFKTVEKNSTKLKDNPNFFL